MFSTAPDSWALYTIDEGHLMVEITYKILFFILLIASLGDILVPFFIGKKYPGYNHLIHTISALGTNKSPVQKYECLNLKVVGILFLIFSIGQWFLFKQKTWSYNWYTIGVLFFSAGCILAGIFPEDPQGAAETSSGKIHGIASGLGFLFLILNPLWAIWIKELNDIRIVNLLLFILAILTFVLFLVSKDNSSGFLKYTGLFQRLNLLILYGTLILNYVWIN